MALPPAKPSPDYLNGALATLERNALRTAYSRLDDMPDGVPSDAKCFLDREGKLHSMEDVRAARFVIDDEPEMARIVTMQGVPLAFADIGHANTAKVLRFYNRIGVRSLTEVSKRIGSSTGEERQPPTWFDSTKVLRVLHSDIFASALAALAAYTFRSHQDMQAPDAPLLLTRLQAMQRIDFAQELRIKYRIGGNSLVSVPTDVLLEQDRLVLSWANSRDELNELMARGIADLLFNMSVAPQGLPDAIYRLLTCRSPREMERYLRRRGIPWRHTMTLPDESIDGNEEFAEASENDDQTIQQLLASTFTELPVDLEPAAVDTVVQTTNTSEPNEAALSREELALPPIESIQATCLDRSPLWSPSSPRSGASSRSRPWSPPSGREADRDRKIGHRGEEIIYRREVARVTALGYGKSRVIWTSQSDPGADYDILSVDRNGDNLWIEVKSTTGGHGRFHWSIAEFEKARRERDHYVLWRVYEADSASPSIKSFRDPVAMFLDETMGLNVATLYAEVEPLDVPD